MRIIKLLITSIALISCTISVLSQVEVKDNAKVGVIIAGSGNEINITQILDASKDYKNYISQLKRLDSLILIKTKHYKFAIQKNEKDFEQIFRSELILLRVEKESISKLISQFKEDVQQLANIFESEKINSIRLNKAKRYFEEGEIQKANNQLNVVDMELEGNYLLTKKSFNDSLLQIIAEEFLIKAQMKKLDFRDSLRHDSIRWCYQKSLTYLEYHNNLSDYASYLSKINEIDSAIILFEKAIGLIKLTNDKKELTSSLNNVSLLYIEKDVFVKAKSYLLDVIKLSEDITDSKSKKIVLLAASLNLANIYNSTDSLDKAEELYLKVYNESDDLTLKTNALSLVLLNFRDNGKLKKRNEYIQKGIDFCGFNKSDTLTYKFYIADFYAFAGLTFIKDINSEKNLKLSISYFLTSYGIKKYLSEKYNDPEILIKPLSALALANRLLGNYTYAEKYIIEAINITKNWKKHYKNYTELLHDLIAFLFRVYALAAKNAETEMKRQEFYEKLFPLAEQYPFLLKKKW